MVTGAWSKLRTLTECRRIYERKAGFSQRIQLESQEQKARAAQSRYTTALRIFRNIVSLTSFPLLGRRIQRLTYIVSIFYTISGHS
jgi:hypothetical protein